MCKQVSYPHHISKQTYFVLNDKNKLESCTCCLNSCHHPMNLSQLCPCSYTSVTCTSHCTTHHWPYCPLQNTCMSYHTHLDTSSGVQLVLVNGQLHNFSMTVLSCHMQHGETIVVSTVVQRLHLGSHVLNSADMATRCSQVEGIASTLQTGNA